METQTRDESRSKLDEFASMPMSEVKSLPVVQAGGMPMIVGSQNVAKPRDEAMILKRLKVLASAAGEDWYYRFPVKDNKTGRTSWIEGPTIKLANAVARLYGNCEVDTREQDMGTMILFHSRFIDVETGYALTRPFQQRKSSGKIGGDDQQRRDNMAEQIGASKATRNVIVNALQTFCDYAFEEAKNSLVDKIGHDLPKWRDKTVEKLSQRIDIRRVEAVLGRAVKDWLAPDVAKVIAMGKAIEEGMATMDETFPELRADPVMSTTAQLDGLAGTDPSAGDGKAAAPGSPTQPAGAAADLADDRPEIVDKIVRLASDAKLSSQDRLELLEQSRDQLLERYPQWTDFIQSCGVTAAKIATDVLTAAQARSYLQGLIK